MPRTIIALLTVVFTSLALAAMVPIEREAAQSSLYREILDRLATRHYQSLPVDDTMSARYLDSYIESLDPTKSYFLQADIDEFQKWRSQLDDLAKRGDVEPGYIIFNRLRARAEDRLAFAISLLEDATVLDLNSEETIVLDGEKREWLSSEQEANDYWRKRLKDQMIRLLLSGKDEQAARELLLKRFNNQLKQLAQRDSQDVFAAYVNALAALYDPHSSYFSPRAEENFQISMSLSLEGIGAVLQSEDEYTKVVRVVPGGPADLQGILQAEDKIIGVAQDEDEYVDVVGWRLDDVVDMIRGPKGSRVRLQILPSSGESADKMVEIAIVRDKVKLEEQSAQKKVIEVPAENNTTLKLGVISIPAFYMDFDAYRARDPNYKSTTRDVYNLIQELQQEQIDGLVLDLRNNGGGSLPEATMLTDLFIDRGPVVQIRHSNQQVYRNQRATMRATYTGPMLVLINRLSASASEIFAGAMQDYGRALIVGSRSFGKGTVQDVSDLSRGQLKMTVSKFYRVSGDSTQHRGVVPDIEFPSLYDPEDVGESHEANALAWDQIHAVPYKVFSDLSGSIGSLTAVHRTRVAQDPDFNHLVNQLALQEHWEAGDELSLNLETRRQRDKQWDAEILKLENLRRSAKGQEPYPDMEAWKAQREDQEEDVRADDPLLFEAGRILVDLIQGVPRKATQQVVGLDSKKAD